MAEPMNLRPAGPVPDDVAEYLLGELPDGLDADALFALERLVEYAYATGYAAGHLRGFRTGVRDAERSATLKASRALAAGKADPSASKP